MKTISDLQNANIILIDDAVGQYRDAYTYQNIERAFTPMV